MLPIDKRIIREFNFDIAGVISDYVVPKFMRVCYEYVWHSLANQNILLPIDKRISEEFNRDIAGVISDYSVPKFVRFCYEYVWHSLANQQQIFSWIQKLTDRNILGLERFLLCANCNANVCRYVKMNGPTFEHYISKYGWDNLFNGEILETFDGYIEDTHFMNDFSQIWDSPDHWDFEGDYNIKYIFDPKTGLIVIAQKYCFAKCKNPEQRLTLMTVAIKPFTTKFYIADCVEYSDCLSGRLTALKSNKPDISITQEMILYLLMGLYNRRINIK